MYIYIGCRVLFRNFGKIKCFKKFGNNSVSESLLSQHFDGRSQHKSHCMGHADVIPLVGSRAKAPKAPTILRCLKPENS